MPTPFVTTVASGFVSGTYWDVSDPTSFVEGITTPGFPGGILRIR